MQVCAARGCWPGRCTREQGKARRAGVCCTPLPCRMTARLMLRGRAALLQLHLLAGLAVHAGGCRVWTFCGMRNF